MTNQSSVQAEFVPRRNPPLKRDVIGRWIVVLDNARTERGLEVVQHPSRAFPAGSIQEIVVTDEIVDTHHPIVNRASFQGFVEFVNGGSLRLGDLAEADGKHLGTVIGFDETHMPNHMNVVLFSPDLRTGQQRGCELEGEVVFRFAAEG